MRSMYL